MVANMTFGLVSEDKKSARSKYTTYEIHIHRTDSKAIKKETVLATGIIPLRKKILREMGHISTSVAFFIYSGEDQLGVLATGKGGPRWTSSSNPGNYYRVYANGVISNKPLDRGAIYPPKYTEYNNIGMPIYKIWYNSISNSYDVLARKFNGEWAYGHDYDIKEGVWKGGRYDYDVNDLYKRVGGTPSKVVVDNKRGPSGRF